MPNSVFELSNLDGVNGFTINGIAAGDQSGISVAAAGDVNRDGVDDLIIGARYANPGGRTNAGQSYLVFGHRGGLPNPIELSSLDGTSGVIINGIASGDQSGFSVASAGDVNADGFDDFLIGAYDADPGGRTGAGQSYLIFGHNNTWPSVLELNSLNGTTGVIINGISSGDQSGFEAATIGDVNGDNIDDFAIGAEGAILEGRGEAGQSYIIFGHSGAWPRTLELATLSNTAGVFINGIIGADQTGHYIASAGDMNGDGIGDLISGAHWADAGSRVDAGQSYIIFGRSVWPAVIELSSLNGNTGVILNGIAAGDFSGRHATGAGDVNADGFADVIIGAPYVSVDGLSYVGQSYLVFGHNQSWPTVLELSTLNGALGVIINGSVENNRLGLSVAPAGDVNIDGIDDVIIGSAAGKSYVLFGHSGGWPASMNASSLDGTSGIVLTQAGTIVSSAGDVNGDNIADVIIGSPGKSPNNRTHAGQSNVIFGGAEQFSNNQIEIQSGETLILNTTDLAVEPLVDERNFMVTDVEHGRFAFASDSNNTITQFTQAQIDNGEIVFIHDGSDQTPSYVVSADGVTRVFSNVHPQAANISFSVSSTTTGTLTSETSTSSSTVSSTTHSDTSFTITSTGTVTSSIVTSLTPTTDLTSITINPQIDGNGTVEDGGGDSPSLPIGAIVGGVIGGLALLAAGLFCYRRRGQRATLDHYSMDRNTPIIKMHNNPAYKPKVVRSMDADTTQYIEVIPAELHNRDKYGYVVAPSSSGANTVYAVPYAEDNQHENDIDGYVVDPSTSEANTVYAVPNGEGNGSNYTLFSSLNATKAASVEEGALKFCR
ncbi:MAG: hypothetical protein COB66_06165 [Coxiella sp. (in: Bacteria)]|nr:MAG: hypothetical protein COB66_06165 [Coxiella sp. (in: g-proteobacteria)]